MIRRYSSRLQFAITATVLANTLQWFDFSLFGLMLPLFIKLFFPDEGGSFFFLLFALGALARPFGGIVFGYLGDTLGRKTALVRTVLFMTIPIFLVAMLPSYQQIGVTAGILLGLLYIFQGFCVGGEFPGSIVFLEETSPPPIRGYIGSWSYFGVILGMLLVSVDVYELNQNLSQNDMELWGWRLPFYMGALIGVIGTIMRHFIHETPSFSEAKQYGHLVKRPLFNTFHRHKKSLLQGMGVYLLDVIGFNLILIYSSYFYYHQYNLTLSQTFKLNIFSISILLVGIPLMAKFGNWVGNLKLAKWAAAAIFLCAYPLYWLISQNTMGAIYIGQGLLIFLLSAYVCNMPVILFRLYPTEVRYTCVGVAINFSVALFGGTAPYLVHLLIQATHLSAVPSFYICAASLLSFLTLRRIHLTG
ncbi:MAG: MFS transporter [Chlamydiales bacterium]